MSKPKQILLDCERMKYANTGLYHYCLQLARALQQNIDAAKEELNIYVRKENIPDFGAGFRFAEQHSLHKFFLPNLGKYDVWHCTYQASQYFPQRKKTPIVLTVHDLNFLYDNSKSEAKKAKLMRQHAQKIQQADRVVSISEYVQNDVLSHFDVDRKKCSVIYNGSNISETIVAEMDEAKKPKGAFLFTIGTIVGKKNFHVLPALLQGNDYQLVIAGIDQSPEYKQKIIAEAKANGVSERLVFTGAVEEAEKYWYLQNCEAFLFPSLAEGFGLPVIEAMHFGKPVFLSTLTSLPEIGGSDAFYFDNFESTEMAKVFEKGMEIYRSDKEMPGRISKWSQRFSWDQAAKAYLEVYRSLY